MSRLVILTMIVCVSTGALAQDTSHVQERHQQAQDQLTDLEQNRDAASSDNEKTSDTEAQEQTRPVQEIQPPSSPPAPAQPVQSLPAPLSPSKIAYRRTLALGISTLKELGLAAGQIRYRWKYFGAEVSVGYLPTMIIISGAYDDYIFASSVHVTGSALVFFDDGQAKTSYGLRLGGVYNSQIGGGVIVGFQLENMLTPWLTLTFGAGFQIYPNGESWAKDQIANEYGNASIDINPLISTMQPYIGIGVVFYLL